MPVDYYSSDNVGLRMRLGSGDGGRGRGEGMEAEKQEMEWEMNEMTDGMKAVIDGELKLI